MLIFTLINALLEKNCSASFCSKVELFGKLCLDGCAIVLRTSTLHWRKVKSSHLYLYSAFNNTNCNKAPHNIKIGKLCQKCKMTGFNTQLSAECISLLNLVFALSSLVQFK